MSVFLERYLQLCFVYPRFVFSCNKEKNIAAQLGGSSILENECISAEITLFL